MNNPYEVHQAFCFTCQKLIGRVRKYRDDAVDEGCKHEAKRPDHHTETVTAPYRACLNYEARFIAAGIHKD